jgi:hypothetical protein
MAVELMTDHYAAVLAEKKRDFDAALLSGNKVAILRTGDIAVKAASTLIRYACEARDEVEREMKKVEEGIH